MLAFNDDVAAKIQVAGQQCLFGLDATIGHKQDRRRRPDQQVDNVRLIISDGEPKLRGGNKIFAVTSRDRQKRSPAARASKWMPRC